MQKRINWRCPFQMACGGRSLRESELEIQKRKCCDCPKAKVNVARVPWMQHEGPKSCASGFLYIEGGQLNTRSSSLEHKNMLHLPARNATFSMSIAIIKRRINARIVAKGALGVLQ